MPSGGVRIALGATYMIVPLMTAKFSAYNSCRLLGVILTAGSVAEAISPWLVAAV